MSKHCKCHALMAGECVCGVWDKPVTQASKDFAELLDEYDDITQKFWRCRFRQNSLDVDLASRWAGLRAQIELKFLWYQGRLKELKGQ